MAETERERRAATQRKVRVCNLEDRRCGPQQRAALVVRSGIAPPYRMRHYRTDLSVNLILFGGHLPYLAPPLSFQIIKQLGDGKSDRIWFVSTLVESERFKLAYRLVIDTLQNPMRSSATPLSVNIHQHTDGNFAVHLRQSILQSIRVHDFFNFHDFVVLLQAKEFGFDGRKGKKGLGMGLVGDGERKAKEQKRTEEGIDEQMDGWGGELREQALRLWVAAKRGYKEEQLAALVQMHMYAKARAMLEGETSEEWQTELGVFLFARLVEAQQFEAASELRSCPAHARANFLNPLSFGLCRPRLDEWQRLSCQLPPALALLLLMRSCRA